MKKLTETEVRNLSGHDLYLAAKEAGVLRSGMTQEDVIQALINPVEDVPDWALPDWAREEGSPVKNLWHKLMAKLPERVREFLEGIEFDEVVLPLVLQVVDNAFERRKYVSQEQMAKLMSEFARGIDQRFEALKTPDPQDDKVASAGWLRFLDPTWWNQPVGSKPVQKK